MAGNNQGTQLRLVQQNVPRARLKSCCLPGHSVSHPRAQSGSSFSRQLPPSTRVPIASESCRPKIQTGCRARGRTIFQSPSQRRPLSRGTPTAPCACCGHTGPPQWRLPSCSGQRQLLQACRHVCLCQPQQLLHSNEKQDQAQHSPAHAPSTSFQALAATLVCPASRRSVESHVTEPARYLPFLDLLPPALS